MMANIRYRLAQVPAPQEQPQELKCLYAPRYTGHFYKSATVSFDTGILLR
jgi:hypothetical protein